MSTFADRSIPVHHNTMDAARQDYRLRGRCLRVGRGRQGGIASKTKRRLSGLKGPPRSRGREERQQEQYPAGSLHTSAESLRSVAQLELIFDESRPNLGNSEVCVLPV